MTTVLRKPILFSILIASTSFAMDVEEIKEARIVGGWDADPGEFPYFGKNTRFLPGVGNASNRKIKSVMPRLTRYTAFLLFLSLRPNHHSRHV